MATSYIKNILEFLTNSGLPHRITATVGGKHAANSLHYVGRAVDVAGPKPDTDGSPDMMAIAQLFLIYKDKLAELIYSPLGFSIKNGQVVAPLSFSEHFNHVHVALLPNTYLPILPKETPVPDDPTLPNIEGPLTFHPVYDSTGTVKGYYIFSQKTGELHAFGVPYLGRSEDITPGN